MGSNPYPQGSWLDIEVIHSWAILRLMVDRRPFIWLCIYCFQLTRILISPMQLQALIINFWRWNSPTGTRGLCKDLSKTGLNWVPHCVGVGFQYYLHLLAMEKNILACKMALGLSYIPIIWPCLFLCLSCMPSEPKNHWAKLTPKTTHLMVLIHTIIVCNVMLASLIYFHILIQWFKQTIPHTYDG